MHPVRRYATSQNETASPERLMVLLFQAALRHMRAGAAALEAGRAAEANVPLAKASDILAELHGSLAPARAPALCARLGEIYAFAMSRLIEANARRDAAAAREAERAFAPVAEA
ncbi:MAG: flagellar export chaperone FliS, partial [Anaeromyxobacteraceae bacterium]